MTPEQERQALLKLCQELGVDIPQSSSPSKASSEDEGGIHPITARCAEAWRDGTSVVEAYNEVMESNNWSKIDLRRDQRHNAPLWRGR